MGAGSDAGEPVDDCSAGASDCAATTPAWFGSPLGSWTAIRSRRIRGRPGEDGIVPSMSRPANPYDNASCESFIKTLKREEIYAHKYEDLEQLRANIEEFIEEYYNRQRLHSALGYRSPEEFERKSECQAENRGATIKAFVNKESEEKISKGLLGT